MEKKYMWLELPEGRAGPCRVGQSDGVWSPGVSGVWGLWSLGGSWRDCCRKAATGKTQTRSEDLGKKEKSQLEVGQ